MRQLTVSSHRSWLFWLALAVLTLATLACGFEGGAFSAPPESAAVKVQAPAVPGGQKPGGEPQLSGVTPGAVATAQSVPLDMPPGAPVEGVLITAPLAGHGVRGQIQVEGLSRLAGAQKLYVLVRDAQGTVIAASQPVTQIDSAGKFNVAVAIPADLSPQAGRVLVYGVPEGSSVISHLASLDVQLNGDAQPAAAPIDSNTLEAITIVLPNPGATLQGTAKVSAITQVGPEVVVEVRDANNQVVGRTQVTIDLTKVPAQITAEVPLEVKQAGPGRVLVYALNARDGQTEHLSSIEVQLAP